VRYEPDGAITVDMGPSHLADPATDTGTDGGAAATAVQVHADGRTFGALRVHVPNPHAVAFVGSLTEAGPLLTPPTLTPDGAFPAGANIEFAVLRGSAHVAMRVYERGSGETRSCGTGACAVAVAARRRAGLSAADPTSRRWRVDVPGGTLTVTERSDGRVELTGPAVLVAAGEVRADWLAARTAAAPAVIPA
jgi:diaminopimelate epimerase